MPKNPRRTKRKSRGKSIVVPYARGYIPPTEKQSQDAITSHAVKEATRLPRHLQPANVFHTVSPPSSVDDWLAQYNEEGQTYRQFKRECPWLRRRKWKQIKQTFVQDGNTIKEKYPDGKIYLLQLGDFDNQLGSTPNFQSLVEYVETFYELPVRVLHNIELCQQKTTSEPEAGQFSLLYNPPSTDVSQTHCKRRVSTRPKRYTLEHRHNSKTEHTQLRINSILTTLKYHIPDDALFVMALTMYDLFEEPSDLFVAGMAAGNHRVGVFSFSRYDPSCTFSSEFWYEIAYDKKEMKKEKVILQRSCKLLIHEIAHLLGVDHCIWYDCCMNGSGHLEEDFRQPMFLCPVDLHKLETLCGFEVTRRYKKMNEFFQKH